MASKKANSNLLKDAIADAKAVRETALKNAELAIQEALTPRLQSIISRKIQSEMEGDEDLEEDLDSSDIGLGDNKEPADTGYLELDSETEEETSDVGEEDENFEVIDDLMEDEDMEDDSMEMEDDDDYDEDEVDLEEIIRELEGELEESDDEFDDTNLDEDDDEDMDLSELFEEDDEEELDLSELYEEEDEEELDLSELYEEDDTDMEMEEGEEDIDLDEILREMGYGDDEDVTEGEHDTDNVEEMEAELEEAYKTINILKKTINEVNLLNAKLLYANKVFRQYNLTNEQKIKIVESFDRTGSVREVKLVFATISESMKLAGSKKMKKLTEGFASKSTKSTAPKGILKENVDFTITEFQKRNQELAGIIKK